MDNSVIFEFRRKEQLSHHTAIYRSLYLFFVLDYPIEKCHDIPVYF